MPEPLSPTIGLAVLHLFFQLDAGTDRGAVVDAVHACLDDDHQVISFAALGHKADLGVLGMGKDLWRLRRLQTELVRAGLVLVDSYVSMTEASEYAAGLPEEMINARLYPSFGSSGPQGMRAICFYPMSKRRGLGDPEANWYTLPFDDRKRLMHEHGTSGRKFAGRVTQLVTGSTGLDDFEWGVTLFAHDPADLKHVVYTMRFDEASAVYAEFGTFITGMIDSIETLCDQL